MKNGVANKKKEYHGFQINTHKHHHSQNLTHYRQNIHSHTHKKIEIFSDFNYASTK